MYKYLERHQRFHELTMVQNTKKKKRKFRITFCYDISIKLNVPERFNFLHRFTITQHFSHIDTMCVRQTIETIVFYFYRSILFRRKNTNNNSENVLQQIFKKQKIIFNYRFEVKNHENSLNKIAVLLKPILN